MKILLSVAMGIKLDGRTLGVIRFLVYRLANRIFYWEIGL